MTIAVFFFPVYLSVRNSFGLVLTTNHFLMHNCVPFIVTLQAPIQVAKRESRELDHSRVPYRLVSQDHLPFDEVDDDTESRFSTRRDFSDNFE
jgi:hypothetical protein